MNLVGERVHFAPFAGTLLCAANDRAVGLRIIGTYLFAEVTCPLCNDLINAVIEAAVIATEKDAEETP